jgi:hypothetical protein
MMSSYGDVSPLTSPRNSIRLRSESPDMIEPAELGLSGAFNLADELAMAEDSDHENGATLLVPPQLNRLGSALSDYEGSEYGDIDDDSDGYLSDHVDLNEQQLQALLDELATSDSRSGIIAQFVQDLRGMRGQMGVEDKVRRYHTNSSLLSLASPLTSSNRLITMQRSLASTLDHHLRLLRDIPVLSPVLLQDDTFLVLLTGLNLPPPAPISELLSDSSLDLTALSDTLAMARQEQLQITRKLRSVKDSWLERKHEWDILNERMAWLAENDSLDRRARGCCAREVHGVMKGFDKLLGGMERQMYSAFLFY